MNSFKIAVILFFGLALALSGSGCHIDTEDDMEPDKAEMEMAAQIFAAMMVASADSTDTADVATETTDNEIGLRNILIYGAQLSPEFHSYVSSYAVELECDSASMEMTVVPNIYEDLIYVNDNPVEGGLTYNYAVSIGSKAFTILVESEDGLQEKTYVINTTVTACSTDTSVDTGTDVATGTDTGTDTSTDTGV